MQPSTDILKRLGTVLLVSCLIAGCAPSEPSPVALGLPGWLIYVLAMLLLYVMFLLLSQQDVRRRAHEHAQGDVSPTEAFLNVPEYDAETPPHLHSALVMLRTMAVEGYDEHQWRGVFVAWAQGALVFAAMTAFGWLLSSVFMWLFS